MSSAQADKQNSTLDAFRARHPPKSLTHILYHAKCHDGIAAAWVSLLYARKMDLDEPKLVPVRASATWFEIKHACPEIDDACTPVHIMFMDVAPTLSVVRELRSRGILFGILDHHKSNERDLMIEEAYYNMDRSGCILSYFYFFGQVQDSAVPWILLYIEDKDLFLWRRGRDSFMFHLTWNANIVPEEKVMFPLLFSLTQRRVESETMRQTFVQQGYQIQVIVEAEANDVLGDATVLQVSFDGGLTTRLVLIANYVSNLLHDVAHYLVERSFDMVIFWRKSSRTRLIHSSLITTVGRGIDVSQISCELATSCGGTGGGHELASGMQTRIDPEALIRSLYTIKE